MGLDSIIDNDEEYKSTLNYILINNGVCKTMKEINYSLNKVIDDAKREGRNLFEESINANPKYKTAIENKKKRDEEEKKIKLSKSKFSNKY